MLKRFISSSTLHAGLCASLVVLCVFTSFGQSGRRARMPTAPVPAAEPTPEPVLTSTKSTDDEKTTLTLIVGIDRYSDVFDIPLSFYASVAGSCADRLDDSRSVRVSPTSESMSRSAAHKRAKDEKTAYVVSLQLRSDSTRVGTQMTRDLNDVYIEYAVFAPTTAKIVASGTTYQRDKSIGGVITRQPTGRNTIADHEYWLKQAARVAAERILASFSIHVTRP
jgi:hypothetical protein